MKFKNYEILDLREAFNKVSNTLSLPIAIAWKRRLNYEKILNISSIIFKALDEISEQYADDDHSFVEEETGMRKVKPEYMNEISKKRQEILDQETDIDINMINIEDLGDDICITDNDMNTLAFMINKD